MNTNNKIHTFGDNNIELQNITARDINIITGNETSPEIKNKKTEIAENIVNLIKQLATFQSKKEENISENKIETEQFNDIFWDDLIEAIEFGNCVLFLGQDIATDKNGNSLHEEFYKSISKRKIEYNEQDGFFMPGADKQIKIKAMNFYNKEFTQTNKNGYNILQKLSQIPFSLTISISPDDTMERILKKYNKEHTFLYFNGTKQETEEPTKEKPIIYNLLGNTAVNGKYIFTHEQFYEYINSKQEVKIPTEIETKVKEAAHYIFIGIDFNKWYNRLLLFTLNLDNEVESYSFNTDSTTEINQDFINQQFNISFIDSNFNDFTDTLLQKCKKAGLYKSVIDTFIENTLKSIEKLKNKAIDTDSIEKLSEIETGIDEISLQINKHN